MIPTSPEEPMYLISQKQINALRLELDPSIIDNLCSRPLAQQTPADEKFMISFSALMGIHRELSNIDNMTSHIKNLLVPLQQAIAEHDAMIATQARDECISSFNSDYEKPCLACQYSKQACAYIVDGEKEKDACMDVKIWLRHQKKRSAEQRIKDVIAELNRRQIEAQKRYTHACEIEDGNWVSGDMRDRPSQELTTLKEIIALLRGDDL